MILETRRNWLLRQAKKVGQQRKRSAAEKLYRDLLEEAPDTVEAWFGLAELTVDDAEREQCYARALELEPGNETALAALRGEEIESLFVIPPEPEPEPEPEEEDGDDSEEDGDAEEDAEKDRKPKKRKSALSVHVHKLSSDGRIVVEGMEDEEETAVSKESDVDHCYRHHDTPTSLRCYDCDKLICIKCANKTPVGYI